MLQPHNEALEVRDYHFEGQDGGLALDGEPEIGRHYKFVYRLRQVMYRVIAMKPGFVRFDRPLDEALDQGELGEPN